MLRSLFAAARGNRSARPTVRNARFRPHLDHLEDRVVPAVTASVANEVLIVRSDTAADAMTIDADQATNHIRVLNSVGTAVFDRAIVENGQVVFRSIRVEGGGGTDILRIAGTLDAAGIRTDIVVDGAVESVRIGRVVTGGENLNDIHSNVTLQGASSLVVNDSASGAAFSTGGSALISWGSITYGRYPDVSFRVDYGSLASLSLLTGNGVDTVYVWGNSVPTTISTGAETDTIDIERTNASVQVDAGNGADTITVGTEAHALSNLVNNQGNAPITLTGGSDGATDTLVIDDSTASSMSVRMNQGTGATTTLQRNATASPTTGNVSIAYSGFETVDFFAASGGLTSTVVGFTPAGTSTHVHASNSVVVRDSANTLSGIHGTLDVVGPATGTQPSLILDDTGLTVARTFAISQNRVVANGVADITFTNVRSLGIQAGTGSDTFNVASLPQTSQGTNLLGGEGGDTLRGTSAGNVFNITGEGRGSMTSGGRQLSFESMVQLTGGSGDDQFVFANNAARAFVAGGAGLDTADFSARTVGVTVDLGDGRATLDGDNLKANELEIVLGSSAGDNLFGSEAAEVLVGNAGADLIEGRGGLDVLIGGSGTDRLFAGTADTILIGGGTQNDDDAAALASIARTWQSKLTYDEKFKTLTDSSSGLLRSSRHIADTAVDHLVGGLGRDLFFRSANDILDVIPQINEIVVLV